MKNVAFWIHHGFADDVVRVAEARRMVVVLKRVGADVTYTEYEPASGMRHAAWDAVDANPEVAEWMFEQRR